MLTTTIITNFMLLSFEEIESLKKMV